MKDRIYMYGILLLLSSFFILSKSTAQNYQNGSVLFRDGKHVNGYIRGGNWSYNPNIIHFKKEMSDESLELDASEVQSFTVNNETFIGLITEIEDSPRNVDIMNDSKIPVFRNDTVFLRQLVKGVANLYYLKDRDDVEHFFIQKDTSEVEELIYRIYKDKVDQTHGKIRKGHIIKRESFKYRGQLTYYFRDHSQLLTQIKNLDYKMKPIILLFEKYNKFHSGEVKSSLEKEKVKLSFHLVGGLTSSKLNITGSDNDLSNADFNSSKDLTTGVGLDIIFPRMHQRFSIYNEMGFRTFDIKGDYHEEVSDILSYDYTNSFNFTYFTFITIAKYRFLTGPVKPYVGVGFSNSFPLKKENYCFRTAYYVNDINTRTTDAIEYTRNYTPGFILSVGTSYKILNLEARYEFSPGISEQLNVVAKLRIISILLSLKF